MTKYVNEDKMDCMLRKAKRRKTQCGKETAFTLNGCEVEQEKLNRFQKRRKLHNDEIGSSTVCRRPNLPHCYDWSDHLQLQFRVSITIPLRARALTPHKRGTLQYAQDLKLAPA